MQQQAPTIVSNPIRGQNRRGRGRTNSSSSNSQRRDYGNRSNNQQDVTQTVMDPQPQMLSNPSGQYQYYVPYNAQPAGTPVYLHPGTQPTGAPLYLQQMPMHAGYPMYGYPQMFPVVPHEYIVDEKGIVDDPGSESVPQMWSPNHEFQDSHHLEQQHITVQDEYVGQQVTAQNEDVLLNEDINQNAHNNITMHHQPLQIHHSSVPHSVLNPNVPNFTVVNQTLTVQNDLPQHHNNNNNGVSQPQQQEFQVNPQSSISPVTSNVIAQSYANVSQSLAIATTTDNKEQTFIQAAAAVTLVNTASTYTVVESIPGITTVQQIENAAVAAASASTIDQSCEDYMLVKHLQANNENIVVKAIQVPSTIPMQQQSSPLPQRIRETQNPQVFTSHDSNLSKTSPSESLSSSNVLVKDVPNQVSIPPTNSPIANVPALTPLNNSTQLNNKQGDSTANRVIKPMNEKTVVKSDRFGGASNAKPVTWNTIKKTTASVAVSAVPAKESQINKFATVSPTITNVEYAEGVNDNITTSSSSNIVSVIKNNASSLPKQISKTANKEINKDLPEALGATHKVESKKVEQQNKEVTANVADKKTTLSLAPPPPPSNAKTGETKQIPTQSWASLFSNSVTNSKQTLLPSLNTSGDTLKRPVAKVSPFDSTSTTPSQVVHTTSHQKQSFENKPVADEYSLKLSNFLQNYKIDNNSISILPRGLINRSNYCYINGILQALVSCPPFYHLMRDMPKQPLSVKAKGCTPILDAM